MGLSWASGLAKGEGRGFAQGHREAVGGSQDLHPGASRPQDRFPSHRATGAHVSVSPTTTRGAQTDSLLVP